MEEIEVKILEVDRDKIISRLNECGAQKIFEGTLHSIYLETSKGKVLRLRRKGDKTILTLKVKKEDAEFKVNTEYEIEVDNFEETRRIFRHLGYTEKREDNKKRISYVLKNSVVEIDEFPGIPPFLEIESESKEEIKKIVALLGFSFSQTTPWSGKEVVEYYHKKVS